jgi:hypothetical protein
MMGLIQRLIRRKKLGIKLKRKSKKNKYKRRY